MVRLTRAQQQARTRASVLAAARQEFIEQGYALAKIDRIAERAEMTRGAVYSNFPGKQALYLAVLVEMVEQTGTAGPVEPPRSLGGALGAFARAWLERLPLVDDTASGGRLQLRSLVGVVDDERGRAALAEIARLEALLLAMALETCEPEGAAPRRVRLAELVLTLLGGSGLLAEMAPGFGDPFDRARACEHLAGLDLADTWAPPHLPYVGPAHPCRDPWAPPTGPADLITGDPVDLGADGTVTVLGAQRLAAAEEAVRSARPGDQVTVAVATGGPAETGDLVRLRVRDLTACLRRVFPPGAWGNVRLVVDDGAVAAAAIGVPGADGETEAAVRVQSGTIVARASGRGAAHAAAAATAGHGAPPRRSAP
ncbi:TetR family transcriptional regulator [Murinocardiopsis flavida]|uniref:TetR family transcriptional regulator n=1 Tax=Murinocardiopsis flavida TaxID=645275 RepID=A0A2P8DTL4_9ACTN|nr:TetR/AcrR family transcriptional regulator [Murinocardiopsis flavida]PSL00554.1 TetR family transcriptional regulator [Murinocardiopsis flavida]